MFFVLCILQRREEKIYISANCSERDPCICSTSSSSNNFFCCVHASNIAVKLVYLYWRTSIQIEKRSLGEILNRSSRNSKKWNNIFYFPQVCFVVVFLWKMFFFALNMNEWTHKQIASKKRQQFRLCVCMAGCSSFGLCRVYFFHYFSLSFLLCVSLINWSIVDTGWLAALLLCGHLNICRCNSGIREWEVFFVRCCKQINQALNM